MLDLRIAIVADFLEERWLAMDLVAEMLQAHLARIGIEATLLRPKFVRVGSTFRSGKLAENADRIFNRLINYPLSLRGLRKEFDLFHIIDHSYSHLIHYLPRDRTIVTCHDLDTFRSILDPASDPRSAAFRLMTRHILDGFRKAAFVTMGSRATRDEVVARRLFDPDRIVVIHDGVHPTLSVSADPAAEDRAAQIFGRADAAAPELLHVGSTIPRKRIDVLLRVFARVRSAMPRTRLIQVGGEFTPGQAALARQLGLDGAITIAPLLDRELLGAVYRRAALVMLPSEAEGFGLPLVEGMACGTPVVASDLAVLRELGGEAVVYCPVADVPAWTRHVTTLLNERREQQDRWELRRRACIQRARAFSWSSYAAKTAEIYRIVCDATRARDPITQTQVAGD